MELASVNTFADGVAVKQVGSHDVVWTSFLRSKNTQPSFLRRRAEYSTLLPTIEGGLKTLRPSFNEY